MPGESTQLPWASASLSVRFNGGVSSGFVFSAGAHPGAALMPLEKEPLSPDK